EVTWKIRSWKTGMVPFRALLVYKSQAQTLTDMADAYEYLAAEYGRVMVQAGYSASREECKNEALAWLDPTKRPVVEEGGI
ncbi:hypothetical protein, partial [Aeromonas caviae]